MLPDAEMRLQAKGVVMGGFVLRNIYRRVKDPLGLLLLN